MIAHLPPWLPTEKAVGVEEVDVKVEEGEERAKSTTSSFLSLAGLNLDLVLENGARLYSADLREFAKDKPSPSKRAKRCSSYTDGKAEKDTPTTSSLTNVSVLLDRQEMNRQLGLEGQAGAFICNLLESNPSTSISRLISEADLTDGDDTTSGDSEGNDTAAISANVLESVKQAYKKTKELKVTALKTEAGSVTMAAASAAAAQTDWPLNSMCVRLLADLWDCRWETRHGAASGLRELLSFPQHTRQAGGRNGASEEENRVANRVYLEDVVVRVLCTLALDQFSDFACDMVVAPVRQTAAQLLGVLCLHLDVGQVRLVVQHLLCLVCLLHRQRQEPMKRTRTPKVNWMVVHSGLLGLNYLLSARSDLATDLLPLVYGPLTNVLFPRYDNSNNGSDVVKGGAEVEAGEEDIRCAACNALLSLPRDLLIAHSNAVGHRLVHCVWRLLERAAGELSPITGPLLTLASGLIDHPTPSLAVKSESKEEDGDVAVVSSAHDSEAVKEFARRVVLVLHFVHHSSSDIRRTAIQTLDSLLSLRLQKISHQMEPSLLECVFEQLFHRALFEPDRKNIRLISDLWHRLAGAVPVGLLAQATLNRVDFWLCQAMQPTSMPFADTMLRLLTTTTNHETPQTYYIGGYEMGATSERVRQSLALETRITATVLLASLSSQLCESRLSTVVAPLPTTGTTDSASTEKGGAGDSSIPGGEMSIGSYLLEHVVGGTHLRDRLGMQRFIGSLLLAAWPPAATSGATATIGSGANSELPNRLNSCLTNVVYYEEILGVFKTMHEDCHRLRALCETTRLPINTESPKAGGSVMNLVECQTLLQRVGSELPVYSPASTSADANMVKLTELEFEELQRALQKAQLSVSRCLALQLFWSSRVELSLSSALVNFGWVTPGRLTPLIRPFMDTVRGTTANTTAGQPLNDFDLPQPSENLRLQRLAAWNLARLLWSEFCQQVSSPRSSTPTLATSKALAKVTQNLTKYILPDEFAEWDALVVKAMEDGGREDVYLTALLISQAEEKMSTNEEKDDYIGCGGGCSSAVVSTIGAVSAATRKQSISQLRRCGSLMTLVALLKTFTADVDFTTFNLEEIMSQRLPTLWQFLWLEPIAILRRSCRCSGTGGFTEDIEFLHRQQALSLSGQNTHETAASDVEVLCRSLHLLPAVLFVALSLSTNTTTIAATGLITTGLVALTMCCLRVISVSSSYSSLLPRLRFTAAHTLAVLAASHFTLTVTVLNSLLLCIVSADTISDGDRVAVLAAVYHIIDCILTPRPENQVLLSLQVVPCDQPLSPHLHGMGFREVGGLSNAVPGSAQTPTPLQSLLAYVVVMLTSLVLPHFADTRSDVRLLASNVFTKLLVLLPLEESAPDPAGPGLPLSLRTARDRGRHFVQCLLRPKDIRLYVPDKNVHAVLRPYQQEGVNWLLFLKQYGLNGILADDLGLGKTLQTICALVSHHGRSRHDRSHGRRKSATRDRGAGVSLVVCPATLCAHWHSEVTRFVPNSRLLAPLVYVGNLDQRAALQKSILDRCNLLITTYEMIRSDIAFFQETFWEYLILDEGHIIKNAKSKISCAVKKLRARHRLILTGTPVQNRVGELWSLFDFLMPGFLAPSEAAFNARFARPLLATRESKASAQLQRAGQQALEELHRIVMPFVLRRVKEEVLQDLPPKVIQDYLCNMTPLQTKLYETFSKTLEGQEVLNLTLEQSASTTCDVKGTSGGFRSIKYLLAVCNHPSLVLSPEHPLYDWALEHCADKSAGLDDFRLSGKLMALRQLLMDCGFGDSRGSANNGGGDGCPTENTLSATEVEEQSDLLRQHRALIFFQTKNMLNLVTRLLNTEFKSLVHLRLDGSVSLSAREAVISRFNADPSIDALLLTTAVGGLGLNLTGADTVIFVEHDWNPCRDLQAMDRAHRIGQRRVVSVFRLLTAGSIEERIMSLQAFKRHLARTLISQPDNRALGEMDTSRLIDNMAAAGTGEGASALSDSGSGGSGGKGPSWGDVEAGEYAAEYDMREFLARLPRDGC
ncbi:TATA binding protein associated factor 172 [Echinococcus multilocularis]|uniref:TATA binding protein associated factor 172 n=2 Tax=Echinococcus multilocularis TaxID=6211 RepID=A0A087VYA0_ECHMU|nr:TATA binding protein associated factor 172 [Echinococcus multilocularis]